MGPSLGASLGSEVVSASLDGEGPRSDESLFVTFGKSAESEGDAERSMTPRCINSEGSTLSVNTGLCAVDDIGNGGGAKDPNRTVIA